MSIKVINKVWQESKARGGAKLVLLALADFANDEGECWPSLVVLAKKAGLSKKRTIDLLKKLVAAGEVRKPPNDGGRNRRNRYRITLPVTPETVNMTSPFSGNSETVKSCDETVKSWDGKGEHMFTRNNPSRELSEEPSLSGVCCYESPPLDEITPSVFWMAPDIESVWDTLLFHYGESEAKEWMAVYGDEIRAMTANDAA